MKAERKQRIEDAIARNRAKILAGGLTKGKVYPISEEGGNLHRIIDDNGEVILVSVNRCPMPGVMANKHLFNWIPYDPNPFETIYDKYICRNYYTAMAFIVIVLGILIFGLCR